MTWQDLRTVEDVCVSHPDRIQRLLAALDLERPDMVAVRQAKEEENLVAACQALLVAVDAYDAGAWLRETSTPQAELEIPPQAEELTHDIFTHLGQKDTVPRTADGRLQWMYAGPVDDDQYWHFQNRFGYLNALWQGYLASGADRFPATMDRLIRDWVTAHPMPDKQRRNSVWHELDTGLRARRWAVAYHRFRVTTGFSDAGQLLLLSSIPEHAAYLIKHNRPGHNFITMEMAGLAYLGALFPQFKNSDHWLDKAFDTLHAELEGQVYPDGVQKELTAHYHMVALNRFQDVADIAERTGREVPDSYRHGLARMWNYAAYCSRPDGLLPRNNDSDEHPVHHVLPWEAYGRPDWQFIATQGRQGERPDHLSVTFPWAGQLISRSGWEADAQWSFFDNGPWGHSHQHNDKLHLSVYAGRPLLVDSGRFSYQGKLASKFRDFCTSGRAHNTILLGGEAQGRNEKIAATPLADMYLQAGPDFDYSRGVIDTYADGGQHERRLLYVRGMAWIVIDQVVVEKSTDITALWHFHPSCEVKQTGQATWTADVGKRNLLVQPAGEIDWQLRIARAEEADGKATLGWYSADYGLYEPTSTALYSVKASETVTFAWVILPFTGERPDLHARLTMDGQAAVVRFLDPASSREITCRVGESFAHCSVD